MGGGFDEIAGHDVDQGLRIRHPSGPQECQPVLSQLLLTEFAREGLFREPCLPSEFLLFDPCLPSEFLIFKAVLAREFLVMYPLLLLFAIDDTDL